MRICQETGQDRTGQDTLAANPANPAMRPERGGACSSRTPQSAARLAAVSAAPIPSHGCVNYQKKLVLYGYLLSVDDLSSKATRGKESEIFLLSHMHVSYKNKYPFLSRKQALTFSLKARVVIIAVLALSFYPRINAQLFLGTAP